MKMFQGFHHRSGLRVRPNRVLAGTLTAALLATLLVGCGGGGGGDSSPTGPTEPTTAAGYVTRGWDRFEQGNKTGALSDFNEAISLDQSLGSAHAGQGWARLAQATSSISMQAAVSSFANAAASGETSAYVTAGKAAAHLGSGTAFLDSAITAAQAALSADPTFVFSHQASFDAKDLRLVVAFARVRQGDFAAALVAADQVQASGIVEGNPATWQVEGVTYTSFIGAVLAHLNLLSAQFAG
jgi:tetratricopeptide (TPR) repeat protein